ncbi:PTS sugar transporter subunit IIA [Polycladomyces sp. WAk]|uniref:Mannitol-specific phosphotransferase enzyme IIA component n=1 Tax=Polycladomyces zharkentensis TaxID=2807616 RepID=A0ABS2WJ88_9BACL|nr:PTS sugar transporter subunit IIA [Polycladomyces sp. WAk]MBN2909464.1 PTS sugar transporter subunit IIA [Polycladomyces sp. WAk]
MTKPILSEDTIMLNAKVNDKESAIQLAGQLLVDNGFVEEAYIEKMLERETVTSTYIGNHVAIPHGTEDAKRVVKASGISIVQIPEGVDFGGNNVAKLVIGIAGKDDEHLQILSKIAIVCSEPENVEKIVNSKTKEELLSFFAEVN